jgi:hypothetical protein
MTISRVSALLLGCIVAGSLVAQDKSVRTLTTEAVTFKLPAGWEWQSEIASNIAIKKDIKVKDQTYTITADLVFNATGFLEDTLSDLQKKVAASKGDLKDLKILRGEKFGVNPATLATYTRVRGEKQNEFEDERQYLFRRNGSLYVWTERAHRAVQSAAGPAFSSARSAISFLGKDLSRVPKQFQDEGIKYNLPPDWEYDAVAPSKDPKLINPILRVETAVTLKGKGWRVGAAMFAFKDTRSLDDLQKAAKEEVTRQWEDVKDYALVDKQTFSGEKTFVTSFSGKQVPDGPHAEQPRLKRRDYFMKRKGYTIRWVETIPEESGPEVEAALKKARDGLGWL